MFLHSLKLNGLLSFGPDAEAVELRPLNVVIGPNGSGKSNLIEAIGLLKAAPKDLLRAIRAGGSGAWIWQGDPTGTAALEAVADVGLGHPLRHQLRFSHVQDRFYVQGEHIGDADTDPSLVSYFTVQPGTSEPTLNHKALGRTVLEHFDRQQSVLAQVKHPYVELEALGDAYEAIRLYREVTFGRSSPPRRAQPADLPTDHLMEDASNLGLILNKFRRHVPTKKALIDGLKNIFEGVTDFSVQVEGGTVQIFLEEDRWTIPATRLSDGTIRWLALLAILLDPKPPPLVCIEEPELGLHPDLMPILANLLTSASERMQLIVTTHSEVLIDAFTRTPEVVMVCERHEGSTTMKRLDARELAAWLKTYSLGQLQAKGVLGGMRW
jgi:predicted ATPase